MRTKPEIHTVELYLSSLQAQISEQKRLVGKLRRSGELAESDKAACRLADLEDSYESLFVYRDLLREDLNEKSHRH
jgi:hypothetical protein